MARLQDARGGIIPVCAHHLIGRSRALNTVLRSADVSAQHVAISWNGAAWTVRDLASRNGTWLDGRRLDPGEVASDGGDLGVEVGALEGVVDIERDRGFDGAAVGRPPPVDLAHAAVQHGHGFAHQLFEGGRQHGERAGGRGA